MISFALLAVIQIQTGPTLPPGTNPDLHRAFQIVEEHLSKKEFNQAKAKLALIPGMTVSFAWNDGNVPAADRSRIAVLREDAFRIWARRAPGLNFQPKAKGNIKFSFEKSLANDPTSGLPRGIALFFSENLLEPRLEAVVGLKRGNPLETSSDVSLLNEFVFAIGSYLGLAPGPFLGTAMGRSDLPMQFKSNPDINELASLTAIQNATIQLKIAVDKKIAVMPARPVLEFSPAKVEQGPVVQGTQLEVTVQLNNVGNSALQYRVIPDCGCISAYSGSEIGANSSTLVKVKIDTKEIAGDFSKHLILVSNDIREPLKYIPVHVKTVPRYHFISQPAGVVIVEEGGKDVEVYLTSPKEKPLNVLGVEVVGNPGTATFAPWSGELADPQLEDPVKPRTGVKIKVHLDEPMTSGRAASTLAIQTDDPQYPVIRFTIFAQKGIVVLPASVFLGDVGKATRTTSVILSRPNKPFKILGIDSDSSYVTAHAEMVTGDWEYKILVDYSGKAPSGDLRAMLTVRTDDPKQPKVRIPVMGLVK